MARGTEDVSEELEEIQALKEQQSHGLTMTEAIRNLRRPDVRTPFLLITANFILVKMVANAILFYSVDIFQNAGVRMNNHMASIIVAVVLLIGGIIGVFLVQRLPRVMLSMVMMTLMSLCMAVLGTALYLKTLSVTSPLLDVATVASVTSYMFCFGAGAGPLSWVFLGELLPREYKVLSGVTVSLACVVIFIRDAVKVEKSQVEIFQPFYLSILTTSLSTKTFPFLLTSLSLHGTYWLFAAICLRKGFI